MKKATIATPAAKKRKAPLQKQLPNYNNKRRVHLFSDVNERFLQSRQEHGMNRPQWGELLGISHDMVKKIDYQKINPNYHILRQWKKATGRSYAWIIDGVEDPHEGKK